MELTEQHYKILKVLSDERKLNPSTSLIGIDMTLLGNKVGAYLGIGVMYDVDKLQKMGLIIKKGNNIIITQKGINLIDTQGKQRHYWIIGLLLIIGIIASIAANNVLYFVISIIASIIAGIVVYQVTK